MGQIDGIKAKIKQGDIEVDHKGLPEPPPAIAPAKLAGIFKQSRQRILAIRAAKEGLTCQ